MFEITAIEQRKKNEKKNEDSHRDLCDNSKCTNICIIGVPEDEEKGKGPEKKFEEIITEKFPNMGKGDTHPSPGSAESPIQDKPKEEHTETHSNQTDKN